jgi:Lysylphosphatidylglycerol synthase TM region
MSRLTRVVSSLAGIALFVYAVRVAGLATVVDGIRRTGSAFVWILLLSGFRFVVRCLAWRLCVERPAELRMADALSAFITGDAIGNLTFFGPVASEGTKAMVVRRHLPMISALSSIALENIVYALSVAVMVILGALVFAVAFPMGVLTRFAVFSSAAAALALGILTLVLLYRSPKVLTGIAEWLVQRTTRFGLRTRVDSIRDLEDRIHRFAGGNPARVPEVLFYELLFHACGVAEIYLLLLVLVGGAPRTLFLEAIVLETVNRLITIVFKFVPMRIGVDEAGSELVTQVLALTSGVGVTMAIVRKARTLFWAGVGVGLLALRDKS